MLKIIKFIKAKKKTKILPEAFQFIVHSSILTIYTNGFIYCQGKDAINLKNEILIAKKFNVNEQLEFLFKKGYAYSEIIKN